MSALLAKETEFYLWLRTTDLFIYDLERIYHDNQESMIENYSNNFFPPIIGIEPSDRKLGLHKL